MWETESQPGWWNSLFGCGCLLYSDVVGMFISVHTEGVNFTKAIHNHLRDDHEGIVVSSLVICGKVKNITQDLT